MAKEPRKPVELHYPAENFSMRLLTDPQPAIEWFCTGGSVCIGVEGVEDQFSDAALVRDGRARPVAKPKRQTPFRVSMGEA